MPVYKYDYLRKTASAVRAELTKNGLILEKTSRRKPRDKEKTELLYDMALNRLQNYKPKKRDSKIILPYFARFRDKDL